MCGVYMYRCSQTQTYDARITSIFLSLNFEAGTRRYRSLSFVDEYSCFCTCLFDSTKMRTARVHADRVLSAGGVCAMDHVHISSPLRRKKTLLALVSWVHNILFKRNCTKRMRHACVSLSRVYAVIIRGKVGPTVCNNAYQFHSYSRRRI